MDPGGKLATTPRTGKFVRTQLSRDSEETGRSAPTVAKWKSRFEQAGMAGLRGQHRGSRPRAATPAVQARVIRRAQQKPSDGSTHWSCRKLAEELGISKSTVQRVLAQANLRPHRLERYMASNDPEFERKAADIIGLYLNPPQHAAVFCVDEKTAIQALDRLDPVLPLSPGRAERHGFEYYRHWHAVALCGAEREDGPGARQNGQASRQRRFYCISEGVDRQDQVGARDPHRAGQSLRAQDGAGRGVPGAAPQGANL
jgi:transposase